MKAPKKTMVTITNEGPNAVRVRFRDISKSARKIDKDAHEVLIEPKDGIICVEVYPWRVLVIEEVSK